MDRDAMREKAKTLDRDAVRDRAKRVDRSAVQRDYRARQHGRQRETTARQAPRSMPRSRPSGGGHRRR